MEIGSIFEIDIRELFAKQEKEYVHFPFMEEMEYNMIKNAMDKYSGNLSLVASQLGISRQTLYNKIKRYEL